MFDYEAISRVFSGWSLKEIKDLTRRERTYWVKAAHHRAYNANKNLSDIMNPEG